MALKRMLVVGLGSIGRRHARLLSRRADIALELCESDDIALNATVEELGRSVPRYLRLDDALRDRPELVLIATPHHLHAEQTIAALSAGCHVLCEKPMSDTLAATESMAHAAAKAQRVLSIGFNNHFHPAMKRMRQLIADGTLGTIVHIHCRVGSYVTLVNSRSRYQATVEGALLMDYVHQPDAICWWLGRVPQGVHMTGVQGGHMEFSSSPNALSLVMDYDEPMIATIHLNYLQDPERHEYEIVGDRGWALLDMMAGNLRLGIREERTQTDERFVVERDSPYIAEHDAFLKAVEQGTPPESTPESAIISMRIIEASIRSWKAGARVPLAE